MGACDFQTTVKGHNAKHAFDTAHADACYRYGNDGYTGTIAEKGSFRMIPRISGITVEQQISLLMDDYGKPNNPFNDKWGPAGCIAHEDGETFTFFGIASS